MTFKEWMNEVDKRLARAAGGMTSGDLVDWPYRDAYDDGLAPADIVDDVLENDNPMWLEFC